MTGRIRTIRRAAGRMLRAAANLRGINVGSVHFRLPPAAETPVSREPWMRDVLAILLERFDGDFLDVGANLGQTLLQFRAMDRQRRYVGFEPNPHCAAYLLQLISINRLARTEIIPAACGLDWTVGKLHLYQDTPFDSSASMVAGFRPSQGIVVERHVVAVPVAQSLAAADVGRLGIVKIDVEGFEANVIEALEARMASDRPGLVVEILPVYDPGNKARLADNRRIEAVAARTGYRIIRIGKTSTGRLDRLIPLGEIGIHGDMSLVDYVLCPAERLDSLAGP